jgi:hypothetical protein
MTEVSVVNASLKAKAENMPKEKVNKFVCPSSIHLKKV